MKASEVPLLHIAILIPFSSILGTVDCLLLYLGNDRDGNFSANKTYGTTLDYLLSSIATTSSGTLTYRLFNVSTSRPQYPDDIQVLGVCSGDVTSDDCRGCLNVATQQVRQSCPKKKQAALFEDKCWIRYSNSQLYSVLRMGLYIKVWNAQNVLNGKRFMVVLSMLLGRLQSEGNISNNVDPAISLGFSANILRCIHIGLLCVQENETNRLTMASVILMLNTHSVTLPVPTQPAFLMNTYPAKDISSGFDSTSRTAEAGRSRKNAGTFSINEASITEPYPR